MESQSLASSLTEEGRSFLQGRVATFGWIMTQRQIDLWLTPEGEAELMERQCVKRKLMPEDIARIVLFFAADDSGACTNQSYIADGGWV